MPGRGFTRRRRGGSGALVFACLLLATVSVLPTRASAAEYLFWSSGSGPTIGRAQLDGSDPRQAVVTGLGGAVGSVAGGPNFAYWGTFPPYGIGNTRIGRVDLGGLSPEPAWKSFGSASQDRGEVALHAGSLYWLNAVSRRVGVLTLETEGHNGSLVSSTCPGDSNPCPTPTGLAVDTSGIYWANGGEVYHSSLGGTREPGIWVDTGASQVGGLALDGDALYFSDPVSGAIGRVDKASRQVEPDYVEPLPAGSAPRGLAVYGAQLYWADEGTDAVGVAPLSGGAPNDADLVGLVTDARGVGVAWSAPEASVSPVSLTFAPRRPATGPGDAGTVEIENVGLEELSLGSPTLEGPGAAEFALDASGCQAAPLAPAQTCSLAIRFAPLHPGKHLAELVVPNDGVYGSRKISLSGIGTPIVRIASAPAAVVRARVPRRARARFRLSVDPAPSTLECRLDGATWRPCSISPSFTRLRTGRHVLSVRATFEGAVGATVSRSWRLVASKKKRRTR